MATHEFLPLEVLARMGYDAERIRSNSSPEDRRENPASGRMLYRIPVPHMGVFASNENSTIAMAIREVDAPREQQRLDGLRPGLEEAGEAVFVLAERDVVSMLQAPPLPQILDEMSVMFDQRSGRFVWQGCEENGFDVGDSMLDALRSGILERVKKFRMTPDGPWLFDIVAMPEHAEEFNARMATLMINTLEARGQGHSRSRTRSG